MDPRVSRIKDPELCYVFARNALERGHEGLALEAYRHAVDLKCAAHAIEDAAERAALRALYAYEEALSHMKGKRTKATGTWQMVSRYGVLATLAKRMKARNINALLPVLRELGMEDYSFAAVVSAYPDSFECLAA